MVKDTGSCSHSVRRVLGKKELKEIHYSLEGSVQGKEKQELSLNSQTNQKGIVLYNLSPKLECLGQGKGHY